MQNIRLPFPLLLLDQALDMMTRMTNAAMSLRWVLYRKELLPDGT